MTNECISLIEKNELVAANSLLKSLPQNIVAEYAETIRATQTMLDTKVQSGLEDLIANISQNNGHLDAESKKLLKELLTINPNDYWLNFIKNKEK